jgi:hypothetical protein
MAIALVQSKLGSTTTTGANAVTFTSTPTAGNLIVVCVTYFGGGSDYFSSIADNKSNTYTQVGSTLHANATSDYCRVYYAKNITSSATFTITVNFTGSPGSGDTMVAIHEYSGADTTAPLDSVNPGATGSGTAVSPGAVTPTVNGCLIFSGGCDDSGANATPTANTGGGYTLRQHQDDASSHERIYTEDFVQTTAASTTASFTIGASSHWAVQAAVFKPSGAAAAKTYSTMTMMGI